MIDKEKDNIALIALLMVYKSYDDSIAISENVRLREAIAFEVLSYIKKKKVCMLIYE